MTGSLGAAHRGARRHRALITVVVSLATAGLLVWLLAGRRQEFADAISSAGPAVLAVTVLLQVAALVARSEAWHLSIEAAGGTVERRVLYRASSMQVVGSVLNGNLGVAAPIPGYAFPGVEDERLAKGLAGLVGTLGVFALGSGAAYARGCA